MHKLYVRLALTAVAASLLIAGCGSDNDIAATPTPPTPTAPDIGQGVTALVDFISRMITDNSENSDPVDINALTLATDDTAEPTPL